MNVIVNGQATATLLALKNAITSEKEEKDVRRKNKSVQQTPESHRLIATGLLVRLQYPVLIFEIAISWNIARPFRPAT